jgi:cytochrome P450
VARLPLEAQAEFGEFSRLFGLWMLFKNDDQHRRLRTLMKRGFKPSLLQTLRPRIQRTVDSLLDAVVADGCMDFMRDFAHPLPAMVIADMLGVANADLDDFMCWSDDIALFFGNPRVEPEMARAAQASLSALTDYFRAALPDRRRNRGDDLISLLLSAEDAEYTWDEYELAAQCSLLLFAGHETTRNLLGNGLAGLLSHPEQWELMRLDPALIPNALRELLRFDSPVQYTARLAVEDFTWHGASIQRGQMVIALIGSANRDPAIFTWPDMLDVTRKEANHLSFGHGRHVCLGATLTLGSEVAFPPAAAASATHGYGTAQWSFVAFRGLKSLPVHLNLRVPDARAADGDEASAGD